MDGGVQQYCKLGCKAAAWIGGRVRGGERREGKEGGERRGEDGGVQHMASLVGRQLPEGKVERWREWEREGEVDREGWKVS